MMVNESTAGVDLASLVPEGATFTVRATGAEDGAWVRGLLKRYWASTNILTCGRVLDAASLPAFGAFRDGEPIGLITYHVAAGRAGGGLECEIVTHNSVNNSGGVGTCLLAAVRAEARRRGCGRLWLVTTNDNTPALHFYQRREFDLVALHRGSLAQHRHLKPEIPDVGFGRIKIRHEIELEYAL